MLPLILSAFLWADPPPPPSPSPAPAPAPLAISGPARVAPYTLAEFRLVNAPPKAAILWQVSDRKASVKKPAKGVLYVVAHPGEVMLTAQVITLDPATGEADVAEVSLTTTFEWDVAPPQPNPGPAPVPPKPQPAPGSVRVRVVIIEESAEPTVARSKWFTDPALSARFRAGNYPPPLVLDKDLKDPATGQVPLGVRAYFDRAKGKSLPQLYLVNQATGDVLYEGPAYESPAELIKVLDRIGGA